MKEIVGDIWELAEGKYIGIATNQVIKYPNPRGQLVMGAGIALQANAMFPELPFALAAKVRATGNLPYDMGDWSCIVQEQRKSWGIISIPTKFHWRESSDISLIRLSILRLVTLIDNIPITKEVFLPRLGCGKGGLDWRMEVRPMLEACCLSDQFLIVNQEYNDSLQDDDRQGAFF